MSQGLIPEPVRADIQAGVAAALNEPDLRAALARVGVTGIPEDLDEVDFIVMLVPRTHGQSWEFAWAGSDTFAPFLDGYIIETIHALDVAAGRRPRSLKDSHQRWLWTWQQQSRHENR
jgi:hypothetical protein